MNTTRAFIMPRLLLLGILLLSHVARGATLPTVAVVGVHQGQLEPKEQREISEHIAQAIDDTDFFEGRSAAQIAWNMRGREQIILQNAFLGPGRMMLEDGRTLYGQAETEDAIAPLEAAVETLRLGMSSVHSTRDLWDAYVYLGAAHLALGQLEDAGEAFKSAIAVNPLRSPDSARFPPSIIERYDTLRKERIALASTVHVDADEPGTLIYLNGIERGAVPLELDGVVPGENFLLAKGPSGFLEHKVIDVPEAQTTRHRLRLGQPQLGEPAESHYGRARQTSSLYRAIGEHAGTDLVLLAGVAEGALFLQLYNPRTDGFSKTVEVPYADSVEDEATAAIGDLMVGVRDDGSFESDNRAALAAPLDVSANDLLARMLVTPDPEPPIPVQESKRLPRWVTYTIVGVAGAGAVTAGAVGIGYALTSSNQGTIIIGPVQ